MRAIYPGSFDPVTLGHMDIIERCAKKFDELIVAILHNKKKTLTFKLEERIEMLVELTSTYDNIRIESFDGLLIDYAKKSKSDVIIRGLRAVSDYELETQMSLANKRLNPDVETFFLMSQSKYSYLSSSLVKEVASYGGDVSDFVPKLVEKELKKKYK